MSSSVIDDQVLEDNQTLVLDGLSVSLGLDEKKTSIIEDVTFSVGAGEVLGLVGESGSGKSVTCLAAMGLLGEDWRCDGDIRLASNSLLGDRNRRAMNQIRGKDAAMIFQDASASLNPIQTVGKQLTNTVARLRHLSKSQARAIALDLLQRVDLPEPEEKFHAYPFQLSGGQNQRVMIALALAGQPKIMFADEPTTALDVTVQAQILALLKSIRDETGMGVVFVTHDLGVVSEFCDTVAVMYAGRIVETGPVMDVMGNPRHPYTKGLINSMPALSGHIPDGIAGQVPSPDQRPPGCAFAPRCSYATELCQAKRPDETHENNRSVACFNPLPLNQEAPDETVAHTLDPAIDHSPTPILSLEGASCDYQTRSGPFRAVTNVSMTVGHGESLAIIGESGSGKSTIGKMMLGIEPASAGQVLFGSRQVPMLGTATHKSFSASVQLVPQNPFLSLDPRATIGSQIEEPLVIHSIGSPNSRAVRRIELLEAVGLTSAHSDRYPHELSGGQCQRAVIARALILEPTLLICDEATASLDVSVQARIIELLRQLRTEFQLSLVFITHDLRLVRSLCDRVAVMRSGELVEISQTNTLYQHPKHPYTRALLA